MPPGSGRREAEKGASIAHRSLESLRTTPALLDRRIEEAWGGSWNSSASFTGPTAAGYFSASRTGAARGVREVLDQREKCGTYAIYDPALRKAFWDYYVSTGHNAMPDKAAFPEKPWWRTRALPRH